MTTSHVTTHVLDTVRGMPAAGIAVQLSARDGADWRTLADGVTDDDGRVRQLGPEHLDAGTYRLRFETGEYFAASDTKTFHPEVLITFNVENERHVHVPLLLSPYAYSTYRGS